MKHTQIKMRFLWNLLVFSKESMRRVLQSYLDWNYGVFKGRSILDTKDKSYNQFKVVYSTHFAMNSKKVLPLYHSWENNPTGVCLVSLRKWNSGTLEYYFYNHKLQSSTLLILILKNPTGPFGINKWHSEKMGFTSQSWFQIFHLYLVYVSNVSIVKIGRGA